MIAMVGVRDIADGVIMEEWHISVAGDRSMARLAVSWACCLFTAKQLEDRLYLCRIVCYNGIKGGDLYDAARKV